MRSISGLLRFAAVDDSRALFGSLAFCAERFRARTAPPATVAAPATNFLRVNISFSVVVMFVIVHTGLLRFLRLRLPGQVSADGAFEFGASTPIIFERGDIIALGFQFAFLGG